MPRSSTWCSRIWRSARRSSAARRAVGRGGARSKATNEANPICRRIEGDMDDDKVVNPLREGPSGGERVPPPTTMVIFGASGDLTKRKLVPALYSLARDRLLPPIFNVVGVARRDIGEGPF